MNTQLFVSENKDDFVQKNSLCTVSGSINFSLLTEKSQNTSLSRFQTIKQFQKMLLFEHKLNKKYKSKIQWLNQDIIAKKECIRKKKEKIQNEKKKIEKKKQKCKLSLEKAKKLSQKEDEKHRKQMRQLRSRINSLSKEVDQIRSITKEKNRRSSLKAQPLYIFQTPFHQYAVQKPSLMKIQTEKQHIYFSKNQWRNLSVEKSVYVEKNPEQSEGYRKKKRSVRLKQNSSEIKFEGIKKRNSEISIPAVSSFIDEYEPMGMQQSAVSINIDSTGSPRKRLSPLKESQQNSSPIKKLKVSDGGFDLRLADTLPKMKKINSYSIAEENQTQKSLLRSEKNEYAFLLHSQLQIKNERATISKSSVEKMYYQKNIKLKNDYLEMNFEDLGIKNQSKLIALSSISK